MGNLLIYSAADNFCNWPRVLSRCRLYGMLRRHIGGNEIPEIGKEARDSQPSRSSP